MNDSLENKEESQLTLHLSNAREITWNPDGRWVIFSDLHMGNGRRNDDFAANSHLFHAALAEYYLPRGYTLVLNGDVEELHKFTWKQIHGHWKTTYALFDAFAADDRLLKTVGNHDARLIMDLKDHYPYPMDTVLRMTGLDYPILIYHGHQVSAFYEKFNDISRIGLRYFAMPLGIMNYSVSHDSRKRHYMEKRIYDYSRRERIVSIIGHTHRPLFESLTKAETLRYRIEYLLTRYRKASDSHRREIEEEVARLRQDLVDWRSRKRRPDLQSGIYADGDVPVPCLFNSGTVIGKRGITCLEITKGRVRLARWHDGRISPVEREDGSADAVAGGRVHRQRLRQADLEYVMDSVRLLS